MTNKTTNVPVYIYPSNTHFQIEAMPYFGITPIFNPNTGGGWIKINNLPKIPQDLWNKIISLFWELDYTEVAIAIFYTEKGYQAYIPEQICSSVSVDVVRQENISIYMDIETLETKQFPIEFDNTPVINIHTHPKGLCTFSTSDDQDVASATLIDCIVTIDKAEQSYTLTSSFVYKGERLYFEDSQYSNFCILESEEIMLVPISPTVKGMVRELTPSIKMQKGKTKQFAEYLYPKEEIDHFGINELLSDLLSDIHYLLAIVSDENQKLIKELLINEIKSI